MENKHAYLIMAHDNFLVLNILLRSLDYEENDIYLHIDKKVKNKPQIYVPEYSNLYIVRSKRIQWGGYSQIKCELMLMQEAFRRKYHYYHFISGVDMPLKTAKTIYDFFENCGEKNHIYINEYQTETKCYYNKIKYYHFFQEFLGRGGEGTLYKIIANISSMTIRVQNILHIDRTKCKVDFYKGGNWFDITHEMVDFVLSKRGFIKKHFKYTLCADEIFLPTVMMMFPKKELISLIDFRVIDWNRGKPYVYDENDYEMLSSAQGFFARKFCDKSITIVEKLYERLAAEDK